MDPSYPETDMRVFHQADWTDFYRDVKEATSDNGPEPRGKPIILRALWILIMQMTKSDEDPTQGSSSSSIWLVSFGIQRDR